MPRLPKKMRDEESVEWSAGDVQIRMENNTWRSVVGLVAGPFAIYESIDPKYAGWWEVTSVTTGCRLTCCKEYEDALKIASYLIENHLKHFSIKNRKELVDNTPTPLIQWLHKTRLQGKWLEPREGVR
jgi:hypothetical protein